MVDVLKRVYENIGEVESLSSSAIFSGLQKGLASGYL